jgi:L-amino acid N-acyltransferase YncA
MSGGRWLGVRRARAEDLATVAEIYSAAIAERVATFETEPRTASDLAGWARDGRPFVVAERDGRVVGFARAGAYSERRAYDGVAEHAVYVDPGARGLGLGRQLLDALAAECEGRGLHKLTSRIFTDNGASRAAHRAAGFREVGVLRRHARLDGEWKDCVVVERLLGEATR